ncbi:MAG: hypothetical protein N3B21_06545 [Clostridia bacterium]|nr:hypothetical protein [Clostridia bacterium]
MYQPHGKGLDIQIYDGDSREANTTEIKQCDYCYGTDMKEENNKIVCSRCGYIFFKQT